MLLCVRRIYFLNIPISVFIGGVTPVLLRRIIPEPLAFGAGFLLLFATLYPLNRAFARATGRELRFAKYFLGAILGAIVVTGLSYLFG